MIASPVRAICDALAMALGGLGFVVAGSSGLVEEELVRLMAGAGSAVLVAEVVAPIAVPAVDSVVRAGYKRVLAFGVPDKAELAVACVQSGAQGVISAGASLEDLASSIRRVADGETVYAPSIVSALAEQMASLTNASIETSTLTHREHQVARMAARGLSNKEIAA